MSANPSVLQAVEVEAESTFGESSTSFASGFRAPVLGRVDPSGLKQPKMPVQISRQRLNEGTQDIRGAMGGSISLSFMLPGLGGTCANSAPASDIATLLGYIVGNTAASSSAGTTLDGTGTATAPGVAAATGFSAGSLCRVGALGDGGGEGQFYAISTHAASTLNLLTAMTGAGANNDVVYVPRMIYPSENPSTAGDVTSLRLGIRTANQQYICHGCYPTGFSFSNAGPGQQPQFSTTYAVSWWETASDTFPVSTTMQTHPGMTVAAGSLFYNAVGTATRATRSVRSFDFNVQLNCIPLMGPGGVDAHQSIIGARRTGMSATVTWTEDAEAAGTDTIGDYWNTAEESVTNKHVLYTLATGDGRSAALYFPNLVPVGDRPIQREANGLNTMQWMFRCDTGTDTTSDLTLSPWRLALA